MNAYTFLFWVFVAVVVSMLALAAWEALAAKLAAYDRGARAATRPGEHYADVNAVPDPTWDRPFSERDRLREIPLQRQPGSAS